MQVENFLANADLTLYCADIPTELAGCRLGSASSIIIVAYIALAFCETGEFTSGRYLGFKDLTMNQS